MKIKKFGLVLVSVILTVFTVFGLASCGKNDSSCLIEASASETTVKKRNDNLSDGVFSVSSLNVPVVKNEYLAKRFTVKLNNTTAYYTSNYNSGEYGQFTFSIVNTDDNKEKMRVVLTVSSSRVIYSYYDYSETGFCLSFSNQNNPLFPNNHNKSI